MNAGWFFPYDHLQRRLPETIRYTSVEIYVTTWFALSVTLLGAIPFGAPQWLFAVALGLGLYRLLDIYRTQLRVVLVDVEDPFYRGVGSLTRNLILTLVNFLELLVISALTFRAMERLTDGGAFSPTLTSKLDALLYSVSIGTTSGFADIQAVQGLAKAATIGEVLLAIVLLAVVLNLFLSSRRPIREL